MLTKKMLMDMPPETTFATGIVQDPRLHQEPVRWAARRGGIHDWAIYYHFAEQSLGYVLTSGDKVYSKDIIQSLVPCDAEALALYRR